MPTPAHTKSEIIKAIRDLATDLKATPTLQLFSRHKRIHIRHVRTHFGSWSQALNAADLPPNRYITPADKCLLLAAWGTLTRTLGQPPSLSQYRDTLLTPGPRSYVSLIRLCGSWSDIPGVFRAFASGNPDWKDVIDILDDCADGSARQSYATPILTPAAPSLDAGLNVMHRKLPNHPTCGDPINTRALRHAPVNEMGVVALFAQFAEPLGYIIDAIRTGFPDCFAKRRIAPGRWQPCRIEFEFESKNFLDHAHDAKECDVIVCWRDTWPGCPLEVLCLEQALGLEKPS